MTEGNHVRISPLQQRLLVLLARGETQGDAAQVLEMSSANVRYHLGRLLRAARVPNVTALVALAVASGVLAGSPWPLEATETLDLMLALPESRSDR